MAGLLTYQQPTPLVLLARAKGDYFVLHDCAFGGAISIELPEELASYLATVDLYAKSHYVILYLTSWEAFRCKVSRGSVAMLRIISDAVH